MGLRIGSMCSGYEGLGMAVQAVLGGELAWVADNDPGASAILAHRFPAVPNLGDIATTEWAAVEPVDVLTAGFPCQDVSCAGARKGLRKGNRTGVWSYVAEAIGALRPRLVLLENVRGLLSAGADSDMELCPWCLGETGSEHALRASGAVFGDLADLGFDAEGVVVSAADAGAPHRRERVFILAWPAADAQDGGRHELNHGSEPRTHGSQRVGGTPRVAGDDRGSRLAAADTERDGREGAGPAAREDAGWQAAAGVGCGPAVSGHAPADPYRAAGGERRIAAPGEAESGRPRADTGGRGGTPAPDSRGARLGQHPGEPPAEEAGAIAGDEPSDRRGLRPATDWGPYAFAIRRWERVTGRPAPRPTEPGRTGERLSPAFVEWMMGLPEGWVTDAPGLSRNAQLKALGNGVVPQQAAAALRLLLDRAGITPLVAADLSLTETKGAA